MAFKITIVRTVEVERRRQDIYEVISKDSDGEEKRGWISPPDKEFIEVNRTMLEQYVDELDLARVIKAINGID